jgi:thioredoxin-like negative regulator of GroEL
MSIQIPEEIPVMLYFYNDLCAPCKILRPKVEQLLNEEFTQIKLLKINTAENPALAAKYEVFSAPTILVFFEGLEYIRESKYISISELHSKIYRFYSMIY